MGKKRKSDFTHLDEVDRSIYTTFCSAANSLSQLYTQSMNHQRLSFQAGERHALLALLYVALILLALNYEETGMVYFFFDFTAFSLGPSEEKLYHWVLRQQEEGSRVTTLDIVAYLQNELESGADEPPVSPRIPFQSQHAQNAMHLTSMGLPVSYSTSANIATVGQGFRSGQSDNQAKNSVFSNALSSPVRRSIQSYHLAEGASLGPRNSETNYCHLQNRETNSSSSNDSMDMHAESPGGHDFPY